MAAKENLCAKGSCSHLGPGCGPRHHHEQSGPGHCFLGLKKATSSWSRGSGSSRISGYLGLPHAPHPPRAGAGLLATGVKLSRPETDADRSHGRRRRPGDRRHHFIHAARRNIGHHGHHHEQQHLWDDGREFSPCSGYGKMATRLLTGTSMRPLTLWNWPRTPAPSFVARKPRAYHVTSMKEILEKAIPAQGIFGG